MELKICHLYPDVLNLYGDTGNIICMKNRLMWRGIDVSLTNLPIGETQSLAEFDLFFLGGGQDFEQEAGWSVRRKCLFRQALRSDGSDGIFCRRYGIH